MPSYAFVINLNRSDAGESIRLSPRSHIIRSNLSKRWFMTHTNSSFTPLHIAVLTVSDSRTAETDTSGAFLKQSLTEQGHQLADSNIVADDRYLLRACLSGWIADPNIQVIITTGGTGFRNRDITIDAISPLLDQQIPGFGELFRHLSYLEIGSSTLQSQALGGIANNTLLFCLPGSTGACRTGWENILKPQLDAQHKPCNFAELFKA